SLFRQTHIIVAVAVEALGIDAPEVANTRQGDADQAIEELVHPLAAQRDTATDRVALAEAKAADSHSGLGDLRPLASNLRELLGRLFEAVLVLQCLANAHVDDNLLQPWQTVQVLAAQPLLEARDDFLAVAFRQPRQLLSHDPPRTHPSQDVDLMAPRLWRQ